MTSKTSRKPKSNWKTKNRIKPAALVMFFIFWVAEAGCSISDGEIIVGTSAGPRLRIVWYSGSHGGLGLELGHGTRVQRRPKTAPNCGQRGGWKCELWGKAHPHSQAAAHTQTPTHTDTTTMQDTTAATSWKARESRREREREGAGEKLTVRPAFAGKCREKYQTIYNFV